MCKDKQLRLLVVHNKIEDPSKVLDQIWDVKWRWLLHTVYTSTLRNIWLHIKNYTEISMNNQAIICQEAYFSKIEYTFFINLKQYVYAMSFYTILLGFYYDTS